MARDLKNKLISVTIGGVSPLLLNRFPDEDPNEGPKPAHKGEELLPKEQCEEKLYKTPEGLLYFPGANLYSCLIAAGAFQKSGRSKLTNQRSSLIPGGLSVIEEILEIVPQDWVVDSRPIVNPVTRGRRICHRPRFDKWELSFTLDIDLREFAENVIRQLVDDGGRKCGLGDYRPGCKGPFGRFKVTNWQEVK